MRCSGIWRTPRRLTAVIVTDDGPAQRPMSVAHTDDALWGLLVWLRAKDVSDVVVTDTFAGAESLATMTRLLQIRLWLAPAAVADGIRRATGLTHRPAKLSAAFLARWRSVSSLRPYLRPALHKADERQLTLL